MKRLYKGLTMAFRPSLVFSLALGSALLLGACSSDDGSSSSAGTTGPTGGGGSSGTVSGPPAPAQSGDFLKTMAQLECQAYQPCCAKAGHVYDAAKCQANMVSLLGAFLSGPTYHQDKAQICLDTMATALSQLGGQCPMDKKSSDSTSPDNNACKQVFSDGTSGGGSPPGGECKTSGDCASSPDGDVSCHTVISSGPSGSTQQRYCQVRITGKAGDGPCQFVGSSKPGEPPPVQPKRYECSADDGLRCDGTTNTCAPLAKIGEKCSFDDACVAEAYCDKGTCAKRAALGEACSDTFSSGATAPRCGADGRCDKETMKCVARLANGQPCESSSDCQSDQCVNKLCEDPNADSLQYFCP